MRLQLWSYNYDPEPTGIAPLSGVWAREMAGRGHEVSVIAAHPHYPEASWGLRLRPYRELRDGIEVLRLPLWIGRSSALERMRQEASFAAALSVAAPTLRTPDAVVAVSPSFPALVPAMLNARARRIPWLLWLQDVLPDAASVTGILEEGRVLAVMRGLERTAYRSASRVVVISESFKENLCAKGVPDGKLARIYNPASRPMADPSRPRDAVDPRQVLTMGNIGHSQNLEAVVRSFEASPQLSARAARFVLAGDGQAGDAVRAAIGTDRVRVTGVLDGDRLEAELQRAAVAVVSQGYAGVDFNVPSKLMNFMGYGIPTVACVRPDSEVARIIDASGGGWVTDSADPARFAQVLDSALADHDELARRGAAALAFARTNFSPSRVGERFEAVLSEVLDSGMRLHHYAARA